ncbi:MAG: hypothetical protein QOJ73_5682 [Streptosporangiaceae bacterium]|nr:hypothetical protein [Streptosporangiaceae bacterium]
MPGGPGVVPWAGLDRQAHAERAHVHADPAGIAGRRRGARCGTRRATRRDRRRRPAAYRNRAGGEPGRARLRSAGRGASRGTRRGGALRRRRRRRPAQLLATRASRAMRPAVRGRGAANAHGRTPARVWWRGDQLDRHRDEQHVAHDGRGQQRGQEQRPGWMAPDRRGSVACGGFCRVHGGGQGDTGRGQPRARCEPRRAPHLAQGLSALGPGQPRPQVDNGPVAACLYPDVQPLRQICIANLDHRRDPPRTSGFALLRAID